MISTINNCTHFFHQQLCLTRKKFIFDLLGGGTSEPMDIQTKNINNICKKSCEILARFSLTSDEKSQHLEMEQSEPETSNAVLFYNR